MQIWEGDRHFGDRMSPSDHTVSYIHVTIWGNGEYGEYTHKILTATIVYMFWSYNLWLNIFLCEFYPIQGCEGDIDTMVTEAHTQTTQCLIFMSRLVGELSIATDTKVTTFDLVHNAETVVS